MDNCLGFTLDIYGPVSLRRNDLTLFRDSNINERLHNLGISLEIVPIRLLDVAQVIMTMKFLIGQ